MGKKIVYVGMSADIIHSAVESIIRWWHEYIFESAINKFSMMQEEMQIHNPIAKES